MPLESVIDEIYKKGEKQVQKIRKKAEEEAEKIVAEAKERAQDILRKAREEAEKEAERIRRQEISSVKLEMKRLMLGKQKEILDAVFESLKRRIQDIDVETRRRMMTALIKSSVKPGMIIYSSRRDEDLVKSIIQELKLDVRYGGNIECLGGIVVESSDGEVRMNLTFDELLNRLYEEKLSEVSKILFG